MSLRQIVPAGRPVDLANDVTQGAGSREIADQLNIRAVVNKYFEFRGYVNPEPTQALLFLVTEVGELADRYVHNQAHWVRNNPEDKNDNVAGEIGDVLMMLTKFAEQVGVDPIQAMLDKFRKKGLAE